MTEIEIRDLDPLEQADVDGAMTTIQSSIDEDVPDFPTLSQAEFIVSLTRRTKWSAKRHLVAEVDGEVVGYASLYLPQLDNKHRGSLDIEVRPDHRRRGVGSALLGELERIMRADGRTVLQVFVPDSIEGRPRLPHTGQGFAAKHGFVKKSQEIRRSAELAEADEAALDELLARAWRRAEGYEMVQWTNRTPDDLVDALAYLDSRMVLDAPMGDLSHEPTPPDAARLRAKETVNQACGQLVVATALRHKESGTVAGWTDIYVEPGVEDSCWQGITIVDPDHRGHRLGTILKIENHRQVLRYRPMMKRVETWNAEVNDFMININEAVGYRAKERWLALEKDLK